MNISDNSREPTLLSEIISNINQIISAKYFQTEKKFALFLMVVGLSIIVVSVLVENYNFELLVIGSIAIFIGLLIISKMKKLEATFKVAHLTYHIDTPAKENYKSIIKIVNMLTRSDKVWCIMGRSQNLDTKRNAGASVSVVKQVAKIEKVTPSYLTTNFTVWGIVLKSTRILFFPDCVYVYQHKRYSAISYNRMRVSFSTTDFIENDFIPYDTIEVGKTWQYVNKDGSPDRRFNNNRQLTIVKYGHFTLSLGDTQFEFHVSNPQVAKEFAEKLQTHLSKQAHYIRSRKSTSNSNETIRNKELTLTDAYKILGVDSNASQKDIVVAYRKLAQQNHPDKVAGLSKEFKELANRKMKEINEAYKLLRDTAEI